MSFLTFTGLLLLFLSFYLLLQHRMERICSKLILMGEYTQIEGVGCLKIIEDILEKKFSK